MLPVKFEKAIKKIKKIEKHSRYEGAFLFGSVARKEITKNSDLDVVVLIGKERGCEAVNHPYIENIKLDISFLSLGQLTKKTDEQRKMGRIPMIVESYILFDKNGELHRLKNGISDKRTALSERDFMSTKYALYHTNNKVERNLKTDTDTALLAMHAGITDLLKTHYRINGRWWVSDKRIFEDLSKWDLELEQLLRSFVCKNDLKEKFNIWSQILTHIAKPIGEIEIERICCNCKSCKKDIENLTE